MAPVHKMDAISRELQEMPEEHWSEESAALDQCYDQLTSFMRLACRMMAHWWATAWNMSIMDKWDRDTQAAPKSSNLVGHIIRV